MGPKTWLVDSGASKHMTGFKEILSDFEKKYFAEQVELEDEKCYKIEEVVSISFRLESGLDFILMKYYTFKGSRRIYYQLQPLSSRDIV
jgi:hypothetical protein